MNKLKSFLLSLPALAAFAAGFPGCGFTVPGSSFGAGDPPRSSAIFCDVEKGRRCSTAEDRAVGINVALPYETGFWLGKSLPLGLDYSPAALAACGGQPQAVDYRDEFPTGAKVCVNPSLVPDTYATTNDACQAWCESHGWRDGDGNLYRCDFIAWRSTGADQPFPDACDDAGSSRADFQDPRRLRPMSPVVWTHLIGVTASGSDLTKTAAAGWGNAGAISTHSFGAGDGKVEITASEINTLRIFGLGNGDTKTSFDQFEYGLLLTQADRLIVYESGVAVLVGGPYATGDTLEVGVEGGLVRYKQNGTLLYTSTVPPTYPLLVHASFNFTGATLTGARIDF